METLRLYPPHDYTFAGLLASRAARDPEQASHELTAAEIAEWCKPRLAAHKQPRYVVFLDELPHTPARRVAKFRLKDDKTLVARAIDLATG